MQHKTKLPTKTKFYILRKTNKTNLSSRKKYKMKKKVIKQKQRILHCPTKQKRYLNKKKKTSRTGRPPNS
jgi:hypothetical protein